MDLQRIFLIIIIIACIILSGVGDSQFFYHASFTWNHGKLYLPELIKSAIGGLVGLILYWFSVRFLEQAGISSPEIQTLLWFVTTILGIAILSNRFFHWSHIDQFVGIIVLLGIAWLLVRVGA